MTEQEWMECTNPKAMLGFLRGKASDRKLRLFAVACCRRVWHLISDSRSKAAVETAEGFADGKVNDAERGQALEVVAAVRTLSGIAAKWTLLAAASTAATMVVDSAGQTASCPPGQEYDPALWESEWHGQCELLRHIIGNPFRPYPAPDRWPSTVVQLATALYNGEDCGFALHDALLEAGHPDLADHFRQEQPHPKGCWVVDLVLGKE